MRLQSPEYCSEKSSKFLMTALRLSVMGVFLTAGRSAAQESAADVAYVMEVSGRAVASLQGRPSLLDTLDIIRDRTRLDLQANSELRLCHYQTHQLLTLKGPLRASVSSDGVMVENS
jgi:hypothetical protein